MRRYARSLFVAAAIAAALPVQAGIFDDDEARARIVKLRVDVDEINRRIIELVKQDATLTAQAETQVRSQMDVANQLVSIVSDMAKLRGQLEVLTYELESAQKRQKDFYVDLDNRLRKVELQEAQQAEQQKAEQQKAAAAVPAVDPQADVHDYEAALTAFKATKYKDALAAFLAFIKAYPNSTLQPSANFWAAASFRQLRDFKHAAETFARVAELWPDDPKAPDALLAQADVEHDETEFKNERRILEKLVTRYPNSAAAQNAKQRLKKK